MRYKFVVDEGVGIMTRFVEGRTTRVMSLLLFWELLDSSIPPRLGLVDLNV